MSPTRDAPPQETLVGFTNAYIEGFSDRARDISSYLRYQTGLWVEDYILWNEPNVKNPDGSDKPGTLSAAHFAAMLYRCWQKMESVPRIYWGGVQFGIDPNFPDVPDGDALGYINAVYQAIEDQHIPGVGYGAWPWTGINMHLHGDRTDAHFESLFSQLNGIRSARYDTGEVLCGEWGILVGTDPGQLNHIYTGLKYNTSKTFFFSHHANPPRTPPELPDYGLRYYSTEPDHFLLGIRTLAELWDAYETLVRQ